MGGNRTHKTGLSSSRKDKEATKNKNRGWTSSHLEEGSMKGCIKHGHLFNSTVRKGAAQATEHKGRVLLHVY